LCDHTVLPGFGGHAIDLNIFDGTKEEAIAWVNGGEATIPDNNADISATIKMIVNSPKGLNLRDDNMEIVGWLKDDCPVELTGKLGTFTRNGVDYPMGEAIIKGMIALPYIEEVE